MLPESHQAQFGVGIGELRRDAEGTFAPILTIVFMHEEWDHPLIMPPESARTIALLLLDAASHIEQGCPNDGKCGHLKGDTHG